MDKKSKGFNSYMKAIRYNEKFYVYKGFAKEELKDLMKIGIVYKNDRFYIPIESKKIIEDKYKIQFTENVIKTLYFSYEDIREEYSDYILITLEDVLGGYIYICSSNKKIKEITSLLELPFYFDNLLDIRDMKITTNKKFYLLDYIINSDIGIEDLSNKSKKYFYNKNLTLYLHQIVNRVCLQEISFNER